VVNRPAGWMVNLESEVGKGLGDWPFFFTTHERNFFKKILAL
tara:strand:+ start:272 stop:397 length:126 start_codon:yes stop_codon:yes gene_type:complete